MMLHILVGSILVIIAHQQYLIVTIIIYYIYEYLLYVMAA